MVDRIEDLPPSEPYLRLARQGAKIWNRWVRTGMTDKEINEFNLSAVDPLDDSDAKQLAKRLNLDRLPGYDGPPNFENVDFKEDENRNIDFAGFVFAPARNYYFYPRHLDKRDEGSPAKIWASVLFRGAAFAEGMSFRRAKFGDAALFDRAKFEEWAQFEGATFGNYTKFYGAEFGKHAHFDQTTFGIEPHFGGIKFGESVRFDGAILSSDADFRGAKFGDWARFYGTTFGSWGSFAGATFGLGTCFDGCDVKQLREHLESAPELPGEDANNRSARIEALVAVAMPERFIGISFYGAVFSGDCSLRNRKFEAPAIFSGANFRGIPEFDGSEGLGHLDLSEAKISFGKRVGFFRNWTSSSTVETSLRRLRKIAKDVEAHDLERDLFILERKAQRGIQFRRLRRPPDHRWREVWNGGRIDRDKLADNLRARDPLRPLALTLMLFVYGALSDCGRSVLRPSLWLAASLAGFHESYRALYRADYGTSPRFWDHDLVSFTLGNALPYVNSLSPARASVLERLFGDGLGGIAIPTWIEVLSIIQTITGAVLLFLLLLAIRNRFKIN
ncbi:MAG TPA: pentapeptide repeat-containing protein [Alphaproteobacteria bacterium]|nr:pentapeptide repeat-containing protein [Alphaproteobacteria bacterium]